MSNVEPITSGLAAIRHTSNMTTHRMYISQRLSVCVSHWKRLRASQNRPRQSLQLKSLDVNSLIRAGRILHVDLESAAFRKLACRPAVSECAQGKSPGGACVLLLLSSERTRSLMTLRTERARGCKWAA